MAIDFTTQANGLREELVERRRDLHRHPEIGFEEVRTAGIVAAELQELGLEVQTGVGKTGVVGVLDGEHDGPTVMVRADMDALPVTEETSTDYSSTIPGKMHACGHDGHTTILLGVAKLLSERRGELSGRVKFVFQPAEEIGLGAKAMIEDGLLESPKADVSLGLHLWNELAIGQVAVTDGPFMAGASIFTVTIKGKGGHAAMPSNNVDPIVCAAQLLLAYQTIVSRNLDPIDNAVLTVTKVEAGTAYNITPEVVTLRGTFRMFTLEVRDLLVERMSEMTEFVCRGMGCSATIEFDHQTLPVINDSAVAAQVSRVLSEKFTDIEIIHGFQSMTAEDVSELLHAVPGLFFFVGSANAERGLDYSHHHPRFDIDEDVLPLAVALLTSAVASYVLPDDD